MKKRILLCLLFLNLLPFGSSVFGQAVEVTASFDTNRVAVGGATTLRIFAQVLPDLRSKSDRIFSWYVDVLNANGTFATANYATMTRSASDKDPTTSSTGTAEGANRHGIYDTFLNLQGAGVNAPVELMAIPVSGIAPGVASFQVAPGTGVSSLKEDFIVAPSGGGAFSSGGFYSRATATLEVIPATECKLKLIIRRLDPQKLELSFTPCAGSTHIVEFRTDLGSKGSWQSLPNAPHNSGLVVLPNPSSPQFFRVRATALTP
jgi:hypothetical protein